MLVRVRRLLSSPRRRRRLFRISGVVVAVGCAIAIGFLYPNTGRKEAGFSPGKPQVVKEVPIAEGARVTAAKFILSAVARRNLGESWALSTANVRSGLTRKQWLTGEIPVVPLGVPIDKAAITKIIYSHARDAELNIVVLPKANKQGVKATLYVIDLKKVGQGNSARWLVDYAQPQATPGIPHQS